MVKVLIFEPFAHGGKLEPIEHLVNFCDNNFKKIHFIFLAGPNIDRSRIPKPSFCKLSIIALSKREFKILCLKNNIITSIAQYFILKKYIKIYKPKVVFIIFLDKIYNILAFQIRFPEDVKIIGIIYRANFHYPYLFKSPPENLKEKINYFRKKYLLKFSLYNPSLYKLLTFDETLPRFAKMYWNSDKFKYIPEPIYEMESQIKICKIRNLSNRPFLFLIFGYLEYRKGILQLLDAINLLSPEIQEKVCLIIAGEIDSKIENKFFSSINLLKVKTNVEIIIKNYFLPINELAALIKQVDLILCPYIRFPGSSGVLHWAASMRKPIITQDYGLIGYLTRKYKLGAYLDTRHPCNIALAIELFVKDRNLFFKKFFDPLVAYQFAQNKTPKEFASKIIETFCGISDEPKIKAFTIN